MNNLDGDFFVKALNHTGVGLVVTDPTLEDNPIVYVNQGFLDMTAYNQEDILGHNCRFLQGENTDQKDVQKISSALKKFESVNVEILNYQKNGTPFWNKLTIDPIINDQDNKTYFVGVQKDITKIKNVELNYLEALEEVKRLACPIVPLVHNMAVMPLIGKMTHERLTSLIETVSNEIVKNEIDILVIDVSGIEKFNKEILSYIVKLYQIIQLLGSELIISGISPDMIMNSIDIDIISSSSIKTYRSLKEVIATIL
ncbi:PAS domain-containing protein [Fictibacillus nanhaiensis]|uniref:STAS domain-containing protein n=1 Tax=Fictibacillus nanhaiensis TaxID=742169 RepID=UPI002E20106F|nr:PAS domain-containing protein [Fictibacillus nanhaiensis]